jgi:hypothetical protein
VGLHALREGANRLGAAAGLEIQLAGAAPPLVGTITLVGDSQQLRVEPGLALTVDGREIQANAEPIALASDAAGEPTVLGLGSLRMHVIDRGGARFLRVLDIDSPVRLHFQGVERFPVDPLWRVMARLEPHVPPRGVAIPNVLGQLSDSPSPGTLVFTLAGQACRLTPIGGPGEDLFIVFGDATNGRESYGGGRFLAALAPDSTGTVMLDFNRAVNPPCAFTAYATCPLPPPENVLPVAVRAGEKTWEGHH